MSIDIKAWQKSLQLKVTERVGNSSIELFEEFSTLKSMVADRKIFQCNTEKFDLINMRVIFCRVKNYDAHPSYYDNNYYTTTTTTTTTATNTTTAAAAAAATTTNYYY